MKIILASNNIKKISELKYILEKHSIDMVVKGLDDLLLDEEIEEFGETFYQNALIKTEYISKIFPRDIVIGDDSGLCVKSLNNEPGIYSARYADDHDDKQNYLKVLDKLKNKEDKTAKFVTILAIKFPQKDPIFVSGEVVGTILENPIGENGFGYDPIFSHDNKKSFAQLTSQEKSKLSHRAIAIAKLMKLKEWNDYV